jgi:hypothetical protein
MKSEIQNRYKCYVPTHNTEMLSSDILIIVVILYQFRIISVIKGGCGVLVTQSHVVFVGDSVLVTAAGSNASILQVPVILRIPHVP